MSRIVRLFAAASLVTGVLVVLLGSAQARHWGYHHHRHFGGWAPGWGPGWGYGYPYAYYPQPYYAVPVCGWVRVRVWRGDHWAIRRVRRC